MKLVYFDQALSDKAPSLIGAFCVDPGALWVTFTDIISALDRGEEVVIRPASESERLRVESVITLSQIAEQLAERLGGLLDAPEAPDPARAWAPASAYVWDPAPAHVHTSAPYGPAE